MDKLKKKIIECGEVLSGDVLKVGSFLNQQIDTKLLFEMGKEIADKFAADNVTKILTIEASGIALAVATAFYLNVPVVFAKKHQSSNVTGNIYSAEVKSFTQGKTYTVVVSSDYISCNDKVLIVDDFLALGQAVNGMTELVSKAHAQLAGCGISIEKGFSGGGDCLRDKGIKVYSLAIIDSMESGKIIFRAE